MTISKTRVPRSWADVRVRDLLAASAAPTEEARLASLLGLAEDDVRRMPVRDFVAAQRVLSFVRELPSGPMPSSLGGVALRDFGDVSLGEVVDALKSTDPCFRAALFYPKDRPYDPSTRSSRASEIGAMSVAEAWPAVEGSMARMESLFAAYPGLFERGDDDGWGWYRCVLACAGGDPLRIEDAARMGVYAAFNYLLFKKTNEQ